MNRMAELQRNRKQEHAATIAWYYVARILLAFLEGDINFSIAQDILLDAKTHNDVHVYCCSDLCIPCSDRPGEKIKLNNI